MTNKEIGICMGNVVQYDGIDWVVIRLLIDGNVILQNVEDEDEIVRVHVKKIMSA
jgi:hypothetical protein